MPEAPLLRPPTPGTFSGGRVGIGLLPPPSPPGFGTVIGSPPAGLGTLMLPLGEPVLVGLPELPPPPVDPG